MPVPISATKFYCRQLSTTTPPQAPVWGLFEGDGVVKERWMAKEGAVLPHPTHHPCGVGR